MRDRAKWRTVKTVKMYEFQINQYEEKRIMMYGKVFRTFKGYNAHEDAKRAWEIIEMVNG